MDFAPSISPREKDLYMQFLSEERKKRVLRLKSSEAALKCMLTGLFLRYGLEQTGENSLYDRVLIGDNGKPFIRGNPLYFNLSHSGNYIVLLISDVPCGIDIQKKASYNERLCHRVMSRQEEALIREAENDERRALLFTASWSGKEAFLKYTGDGIQASMSGLDMWDYADIWRVWYRNKEALEAEGDKLIYLNRAARPLRQLPAAALGFHIAREYCGTICMEAPFVLDKPLFISSYELLSYFS